MPRVWRWHYRHAEKNSIDTDVFGLDNNIYLLGHYHSAAYLPINQTHAFQLGCFKLGDPYDQKMASDRNVGGWIIYVSAEDGRTEIEPIWIGYD